MGLSPQHSIKLPLLFRISVILVARFGLPIFFVLERKFDVRNWEVLGRKQETEILTIPRSLFPVPSKDNILSLAIDYRMVTNSSAELG